MDERDSHAGRFAIAALLLITNEVPALFYPVDDLGTGDVVSLFSVLSALVGYGVLIYLAAPHRSRMPQVLAQCRPLLIFVGLAALSSVWSPDPLLTARKSLNLAVTMAIGPLLVARFGWQAALIIVARAASLMVVASVVLAISVPQIGVHQGSDMENSVHAGLWRGIFTHKNILGHVAAISLILGLICGREAFGPKYRVLVVLLSGLCLVFARSGGALALTFIALAEYGTMRMLIALPPILRAASLLLSALAFAPVAFALQNMINFMLGALGKDPTLTGRTFLWGGVLSRAQEHLWIGAGYVAGFYEYRNQVLRPIGWAPFSAHNAFLEAFLGLGLLGVGTFIFMLLGFGLSACRLTLRPAGSLRFLPLVLFVFASSYCFYESWLVFGGRDILTMFFSVGYTACRAPLNAESSASRPFIDSRRMRAST